MYIGSCQRLNSLNDNNLSKSEIEGQSIILWNPVKN